MNPIAFLPLTSMVVSLTFAGFVLRHYLQHHHTQLLLWGVGMVFYGIGSASEAYYGLLGWNPTVFRLWYLFGAILVAAWLGQGTVYLLAKKRTANILMGVLGLASIYALVAVFNARLDPTLISASELSGKAITSPGVRLLTPFFNLYGTLTMVGGALYSSVLFWRKRVLLHRVIGNVLIAAGAIMPAFGGTFSRLGIPGALYISELLGAVVLFIGFLRASTPIESKVEVYA
ncbi:hypothetical protein LARV_00163 [Longilinea arvoryzae]|uniref:Histidine kinase N-terminal 7TM region domain-containing protein n=1 Tax=Longilinea arvoryzae TaxID=360412 RepID=A0A0S7B5H5_9CHLR|nr:hypothetical protein [Longilinea arvoryzae]GAP12428.1 hypothetical protein LARV_00163 [Longilinea arvoryzae]